MPAYNPAVVFVAPRPGFAIGAAISFGPRISIGAFIPFGWRSPVLDWRAHAVIIDGHPFERGWANRAQYVHPYASPVRHFDGPAAKCTTAGANAGAAIVPGSGDRLARRHSPPCVDRPVSCQSGGLDAA